MPTKPRHTIQQNSIDDANYDAPDASADVGGDHYSTDDVRAGENGGDDEDEGYGRQNRWEVDDSGEEEKKGTTGGHEHPCDSATTR